MFTGGRVGFNYGFERSVVNERGAAVPAEWSLTGTGVAATDRSVAHHGRSSARMTGARSVTLSITPPSAGCHGRGFAHLSVWARRSSAAGEVYAVIEWFGSHNESRGKRRTKLLTAAPGEWQRLHVRARAHGRAAYATVELVVKGATGPVWFDDVSFALR
jgi:hypothetical protein